MGLHTRIRNTRRLRPKFVFYFSVHQFAHLSKNHSNGARIQMLREIGLHNASDFLFFRILFRTIGLAYVYRSIIYANICCVRVYYVRPHLSLLFYSMFLNCQKTLVLCALCQQKDAGFYPLGFLYQ